MTIDSIDDIRARWGDRSYFERPSDEQDVFALLAHIKELDKELAWVRSTHVGQIELLREAHRKEINQLHRDYQRDISDAAAEARQDAVEAYARERDGF